MDLLRLFVEVAQQLRAHPDVDLIIAELAPDEEEGVLSDEGLIRLFEEQFGHPVPPEARALLWLPSALHLAWTARLDDREIGGEVVLRNPFDALSAPIPHDLSFVADEWRSVLRRSHVFDQQPDAGGDGVALLDAADPFGPVAWYESGRYHPLTLRPWQYARMAAVARGWYGWPYLFLREGFDAYTLGFQRERARRMLHLLPRLAPDADLSPLVQQAQRQGLV